MALDFFDAADYLQTQLGEFYWTLRRGGDPILAAVRLQSAVNNMEAETKNLDGQPLTTWMQKWSYLRFLSAVERAMHEIGRITASFGSPRRCLDSAPV